MSGLFHGNLEPNVVVGGCIAIYENAWPCPEETIERLEEETKDTDSGISWHRATTISINGGSVVSKYRSNMDMGITYLANITGNSVAQDIHNQMYILLLSALSSYKRKFGIEEELYHENYNILKYRTGEEYKAHYDGGTYTKRAVSAIVYLNNDYEGGELEFKNFDIKIKPEPGMLIIFPANYAYTHIAHPVISGTKYAIVTWFHDWK